MINYNCPKDKETRKMKQTEIMVSKPNNYSTFNMLMLLGHTMHEKNGKEYSVQIDWKNDCVRLFVEENQ